jgi:sugar/nucleoside kinase (ribokinase family)
MSIVIVGTVAVDTLKTPEGDKTRILGGSATYAALACSNYSKTSIVGIVGDDFPEEYLEELKKRGVRTENIEQVKGKTFHWTGSYLEDLNSAKTVATEIGVLANYTPKVLEENKSVDILFLANNDPGVQLAAASQINAKLYAMDTMNLWIDLALEKLEETISCVNMLFVNDGEIKQLTNTHSFVAGAKKLLNQFENLEYVVAKQGEFGSTIFARDGKVFSSPAFPLEVVKDPTGAGDTFAGSFLGHLNNTDMSWEKIKESLVIGTAAASFTVEEFGPENLLKTDKNDINKRVEQIKEIARL